MKSLSLPKLILMFFLTATAVQSRASDSVCVNQAARRYAVQIANYQLGEDHKHLTEADLFERPVIIDGKKQAAYLVYTTVGELVADLAKTPAFQHSGLTELTYQWRFDWNLPYGTQAHTPLEKLFCKEVPPSERH